MNLKTKIAAIAAIGLAALPALAVPPDYTTLTSAIDLSTTGEAILAVAALLMVVYTIWKGAKMIIQMFKGT